MNLQNKINVAFTANCKIKDPLERSLAYQNLFLFISEIKMKDPYSYKEIGNGLAQQTYVENGVEHLLPLSPVCSVDQAKRRSEYLNKSWGEKCAS